MFDEVKLSSELVTPKRRFREIDPTITQSPLLDSPRLKRIAAAYREEEGSPRFSDTVEAVTAVGNLVRHTLSFVPMSDTDIPELEPHKLYERPITNCYGYSIIASECLDQIGVEHYISVANEHAFITVFKPESKKAFMLSVADKELYLDVTDVIGSEHPLDQLAAGALFAENAFDSERLLERIEDDDIRADLLDRRPWLHFLTDHKLQYSKLKKTDLVPVMRTYPSYPGRGVLKHYFDFLYHTRWGNIDAGLNAADNLDGIYPDVDPRNNLSDVRLMMGRLEKRRQYDDMLRLARVVDNSLGQARATKSAFYLPDTIRRVGMRTQKQDLVAEAVAQYEALETGGRLREAKIKRGRYLLQLISKGVSG